jgi:hypothetical protein
MMNIDELLKTITDELSSIEKENAGQESSPSALYNLNFFKILDLSDKELIHSRFIAFLLNPKGTHGYENTFLDLFVEVLKGKTILPNSQYEEVSAEEEGENGRVDIIIKNIDDKHHIIIENKIYAVDQPRQLKRYNTDYPKATLVYLTLDSRKASQQSLGKKGEKDTLRHEDYIKLSYKEDIISWIKNCIKTISDNPDNTKMLYLLTEYLAMVERLTKDFIKLEKIWEILERDKENFKKTFEIYEEVNKLIPNLEFMRHLKAYIIRTRFIEGVGENQSFIQRLCDKINKKREGENEKLEWEIIEGKHITEKGWGFRFYKKYKEGWKPDIKIEYKFKKKILENCVIDVLNFKPKNTENNDWPPSMEKDGYYNWHKKNNVFDELIDGNYELKNENVKCLFTVLKEQIEEMIEEIEGNLPNQPPSM